MIKKLEADSDCFDRLQTAEPKLKRAIQRLRRTAVAQLLRWQGILPWDNARRTQFFREVSEAGSQTCREHSLPIEQLTSLVLMAWEAGDRVEAGRRLLFGWLCPTVRCTVETHGNLSKGAKRLCSDFDRPLSRYEGVQLKRFDEVAIDAASYTLDDLKSDLRRLPKLRPLVMELDGMILPPVAEVRDYTETATQRRRSSQT